MNEDKPTLRPLIFNWRHGASLVRYKTRCVPITPGIPFTFGPSSTAYAAHRLFLFAKMPKHQTCTDRHSGSSFSPYRKPSIQASITNIAGSSEQLQTFQQVASQLAEKQRIIIISGAGISTNAGSMFIGSPYFVMHALTRPRNSSML